MEAVTPPHPHLPPLDMEQTGGAQCPEGGMAFKAHDKLELYAEANRQSPNWG